MEKNTANKMASLLKGVRAFMKSQIPENGRNFREFRICINPREMGGEFSAMHADTVGLMFGKNLTGPENTRRLSAFVEFPGSDRQMSNYIFTGTNQEIEEYLSRPETCGEVLETLLKLDHAVWMHDQNLLSSVGHNKVHQETKRIKEDFNYAEKRLQISK